MAEQMMVFSKDKAEILFALAKKRFPEIDLSAFATDGETVTVPKKDLDILLKAATNRLQDINIQSASLMGERDKILMIKGKLTGGKNLFE